MKIGSAISNHFGGTCVLARVSTTVVLNQRLNLRSCNGGCPTSSSFQPLSIGHARPSWILRAVPDDSTSDTVENSGPKNCGEDEPAPAVQSFKEGSLRLPISMSRAYSHSPTTTKSSSSSELIRQLNSCLLLFVSIRY